MFQIDSRVGLLVVRSGCQLNILNVVKERKVFGQFGSVLTLVVTAPQLKLIHQMVPYFIHMKLRIITREY